MIVEGNKGCVGEVLSRITGAPKGVHHLYMEFVICGGAERGLGGSDGGIGVGVVG